MDKYIVLGCKPFDSKRRVTLKKFETNEEAVICAAELKKKNFDVIIVEDIGKSKDGSTIYKVQKYGYFRVYSTINLILGTLFISLPIFCYLYFVYFNK